MGEKHLVPYVVQYVPWPVILSSCLSLSSLSSSLYLSSYPLPLHSRFTLSPPPDKATIVSQMLFNMESLSVSLCRAIHRQKWGHLLLCFASLHIFCAIIFVLNDQYRIYMCFSIHIYITSQHKVFCHMNYFRLCLVSRKCVFCEKRVCFGENLVRLLTQLDFGAFDKS